jgi:hypothetical protein
LERTLATTALRIAGVILGCLAVGGAVRAETPRYSYGELSYGTFDIDVDEFDEGSSAGFAVSYGFDRFQVFGAWRASTLDYVGFTEESSDLTEWVVGGGWHGLLGKPADLVVDFGISGTNLDGNVLSDEKSTLGGYFADVGLRWRIVKVFELNAFATYSDVDPPLGSSWLYEVNALGYVGRVVLGLGYQRRTWDDDDLHDWTVGTVFLRYNFGQK